MIIQYTNTILQLITKINLSLVRELGSCMPYGMTKQNKNQYYSTGRCREEDG
jgi:hypothetical protein